MLGRLPVLAALFALATVNAFAQNDPPANPAQDPGQISTAASATSATPSQPAAKRVWTNEDVPALHGAAPISTVGSTDTKPTGKNKTASEAPMARGIRRESRGLRRRFLRLTARLPSYKLPSMGNRRAMGNLPGERAGSGQMIGMWSCSS